MVLLEEPIVREHAASRRGSRYITATIVCDREEGPKPAARMATNSLERHRHLCAS